MKVMSFTLFLLIFLLSCNDSEDLSAFVGHYHIDSMTSSELVDLNGDNQLSSNMMLEIDNYFDNTIDHLEVRPHASNDNKAQLIALMLPQPYLSTDYPGHPQGYVEYASSGLLLMYDYNDGVVTQEQKGGFDIAILQDLEVLDNGKVKVVIEKEYYDFNSANWKDLNIEILYSKI